MSRHRYALVGLVAALLLKYCFNSSLILPSDASALLLRGSNSIAEICTGIRPETIAQLRTGIRLQTILRVWTRPAIVCWCKRSGIQLCSVLLSQPSSARQRIYAI